MATTYKKHEIDDAASDAYVEDGIRTFVSSCEADGVPYCVYINESNGIQALPILTKMNIPARFCYIKSSHLERKAIADVIGDLPNEMLLSAALGERILVVDYGARKDRSRAVYQGVPLVKYVLDRFWLDRIPERVWIYPRSNVHPTVQDAHHTFNEWYERLGRRNEKKLAYTKEIARECLLGSSDGVHIEGLSAATTHDGDKLYYMRLKKQYFEDIAKKMSENPAVPSMTPNEYRLAG